MSDAARHWVIKTGLGAVILFLTILTAMLTHSAESTDNWPVTAIGVAAFFTLLAWQPASRSSSGQLRVKPRNKRDDSRNV
jgi:uncharacterized membrane protein